mgnify:CR=1 FL=1
MRKKKILIAQGGGPTMVINKSLVGIIEEGKKNNYEIFGSKNGVSGIINSRFVELTKIDKKKLYLIENSPGAALGSTRDKPDEKYNKKILKMLLKKKINTFFYIGGNDSSDTLRIISDANPDIQCIHVPKTIDNDLVLNDHTPGYGSAAKYVASVFAGINLDINSLPGVYLGVIMGRHAGFLTAASSLLKKKKTDGPHLIYLPESNFSMDNFLSDINNIFTKKQKCIVAISEGIKFSNGQLVGEKISKLNEMDAHGNIQLSGSSMLGDYLSNQIKIKLGIKRERADTLGYAQRSYLGCVSEVDQKEAKQLGKESIKFSKKYDSSFSMCIEERDRNLNVYNIKIGKNKLIDIGGKTKYMPVNFINKKKNYVSNTFFKYALPLIGKKIPDFGSLI